MASFYSNSHEGRQLRLDVWQDGGNCRWTLYSSGGSVDYYTVYNLYISINGTVVYNPGTVSWSTKRFPAATGSTSGSVWIGNGADAKTIYVSFIGAVYYDRNTQNGGNFTMGQYIYKPSLNNISISSVGDTSAYVSFSVANNNGQTPYSPYIDLSLTDFGSVVKSSASREATFTGLDANRTYYARGNDANDAGRSYTNVASFTTSYTNPGAPGKPVLSYDQTEPIPKAKLTASWLAASPGSTPIAGYRIRLYMNGTEITMIDTENASVSYTFNSFESYGFEPGDVVQVGIYSYSKDWAGTKHFNGGGSVNAQVYSNTLTIISDKFIYASVNGGTFDKYKMYVSQDGGSFVEVKKEKFKVI